MFIVLQLFLLLKPLQDLLAHADARLDGAVHVALRDQGSFSASPVDAAFGLSQVADLGEDSRRRVGRWRSAETFLVVPDFHLDGDRVQHFRTLEVSR